jgi:tetratricopeptide (TPR) repeat protein
MITAAMQEARRESMSREARSRKHQWLPFCLVTGLLCALCVTVVIELPSAAAAPQGPDQFRERALGYLRRGETGKAQSVLKQGLSRHPRSAPLHSLAAAVATRRGDYPLARVHYQRLTVLTPRAVEGYFGLAQVAFAQEDYGASVKELRRALKLEPDSPNGWAKLGIAYSQLFRTQEAIAALKKALTLAPDSVEAHFYLGDLMRRLSRLDEAETHLNRAIALAPDTPHFYGTLGEVLLQRQQSAANTERALAAFQRALQLDPRLAAAQFGLGRTYMR